MGRIKEILSFKNLLKAISIAVAVSLILSYLSPYIHPETSGLLPLFGLAYPIIVIMQLVLAVVWIFISRKWAISLGVIILIGGNLHFRTFSIGSNDAPDDSHSFKVLSYNVHLFGRYDPDPKNGIKTKNKILDYVKGENPDILCFQEFYHQDQPTDFVTKDSLLQLFDFADYHERYMHKLYGRQNFGIAIFSKYPVIEKGDINFSDELRTFNYCIYTDIVVREDTIRVYNLHLQSIRLQEPDYALFEDKKADEPSSGLFTVLNKVKQAYPVRAKQAEKVLNHIKKSPYPVVVCGDLNDTPMSYTYNLFNSVLTDSFRNTTFGIGKTYAGKLPAGRIDYIFHSPQIGSHDFKIQDEKLSDHYAISCSLFRESE